MTRVRRAGQVTFAAFEVPNYRRYISGQAVSLVGTWMQMTAQSWVVLKLSGSSTVLGLIVALQTLPVLLLCPYGGVIADRVDKRRLMIILQTMMGVQALTMGLLAVFGILQVWEIGVLAALLGFNNAFENPARQSFMSEMVGPDHVRNAVSLNSVMVNVARSVGPAVAGILLATVGDRRLLLDQRAQLRRRRLLADDDGHLAAAADPAGAAGQGPAARRPRVRSAHPGTAGAAGDDGDRRLPDLRVPGDAAGDGFPGPARAARPASAS